MNSNKESVASAQRCSKMPSACFKRSKWDRHREEIKRIYLNDDNTLQATMQIIESKYNFKACERNWKMKLKAWGYEKYSKKRKHVHIVEVASPSAEPAEALGNVQHYTPRPASPNGETEAFEDKSMSPKRSHRHADRPTHWEHYPEISTAERQLCVDSNLIIAEGCNTRSQLAYGDLSIFTSRGITTPKPPSIAVNNIHLPETTISRNMGLEDISKHLAVAQRRKHVSSYNPAKLSSLTTEKPGSIWSDLIDQISVGDTLDSHEYHVLKEVVEKKVAESETLRRRLLEAAQKTFGPLARETCQQLYEAAKFLHNHERYDEIEPLICRAMAGFEKLGLIGDWLACQCFLGHSLQHQDRDDEATPLLLSTLAISLLPGAHDQLKHTIASLQISHGKAKHGRRFSKAISALFRMENLLKRPSALDSLYIPKLFFEGLRLANTYSEIAEFEFAEAIFSNLMPEVDRIKDGRRSAEMSYGYLWYGMHQHRLRNLQGATRSLTLAYQALTKSSKIWFNGEKMKNPWKAPRVNAAIQSALKLPEGNIISTALEKGWWDPANDRILETKLHRLTSPFRQDREGSGDGFNSDEVSHKYGIVISGADNDVI